MKALNFKTARRLTFPITMPDENETEFNLSIPNTDLVKELEEINTVLKDAATSDSDALSECYEIAAKLISCNRAHTQVTPEELKSKYHLEHEDLVLFFLEYMDFINELKNIKNS